MAEDLNPPEINGERVPALTPDEVLLPDGGTLDLSDSTAGQMAKLFLAGAGAQLQLESEPIEVGFGSANVKISRRLLPLLLGLVLGGIAVFIAVWVIGERTTAVDGIMNAVGDRAVSEHLKNPSKSASGLPIRVVDENNVVFPKTENVWFVPVGAIIKIEVPNPRSGSEYLWKVTPKSFWPGLGLERGPSIGFEVSADFKTVGFRVCEFGISGECINGTGTFADIEAS